VLDHYGRRARLAPLALAAAPALALGGGSITGLGEQGSVLAFALAAAGLVACGLVRNLGLRLQPRLWEEWGGPPTTRLLRWSTGDPNVRRRHERLTQVSGESLPTQAEEEADPAEADRRYEAAVGDLRDLTRDRDRFPLVAEENTEYGFRRNCLGLRPAALAVAIGAALVSIAILVLTPAAIARYLPAAVTGMAGMLFWWFIVKPTWVKQAADHYAQRLLETLATLTQGAK
jgi:hypothetical protein